MIYTFLVGLRLPVRKFLLLPACVGIAAVGCGAANDGNAQATRWTSPHVLPSKMPGGGGSRAGTLNAKNMKLGPGAMTEHFGTKLNGE